MMHAHAHTMTYRIAGLELDLDGLCGQLSGAVGAYCSRLGSALHEAGVGEITLVRTWYLQGARLVVSGSRQCGARTQHLDSSGFSSAGSALEV
eukprot:COSAG05_NODE_3199_length_2251_cov_1.328067_3_plen_93_part_00